MSRYIDADNFLQRVNDEITEEIFNSTDSSFTAMLSGSRKLITTKINEQSTADVEEVNHEKWEKQYTDGFCNGKRNYEMICPRCNFSYLDNHCEMIVPEHFNYCPNCGAKMDGE